ncbi:MAG: carboxylating nicotinate-nucleotide diphosphorylase [Dehalococcoidia bacterium]
MNLDPPFAELIRPLVVDALAEDHAHEDATTRAVVDDDLRCTAAIICKEAGVVCGLGVAYLAFAELDSGLVFKQYSTDGARVQSDQPLASVAGRVAPILSAERVALNFMQRLSGIATITARVVQAVEGTGVTILDTRKTTPGLRLLEKYAVRCGGGTNHRMDLSDAILLKDNHLATGKLQELSLGDLVRRAVERRNGLSVEVEVTRIREAEEAMAAGATRLLLDNMSTTEMATVVDLAKGRAQTEASGGITIENAREVALTGVDYISLGALTHSVKALDLSLELIG